MKHLKMNKAIWLRAIGLKANGATLFIRMGILYCGLVLNLFSAIDPIDNQKINISSQDINITYSIDPNKNVLYEISLPKANVPYQIGGRLFPDPIRNPKDKGLLSPAYGGPVFLEFSNGDSMFFPVYESHTRIIDSVNVEHLTFILKDPRYAFKMEMHIKVFKNENIFEQWITILNENESTISVLRLDSALIQFANVPNMHIEWYDGSEGSEAKTPICEPLTKGIKILESLHGNRHMDGVEPFFALGLAGPPEEAVGFCFVTALAWSGSTKITLHHSEKNKYSVSTGVNQHKPVMLSQGERLSSPSVSFTISSRGKGDASRNFHRWMRNYGMKNGDRVRLVDNNTWEGCHFDLSESSILDLVKTSANLGIELFVIDDGWFGRDSFARVNDRAGLGDWQTDPKRFPNGLEPIFEACKNINLELGIWFEPEMVNPHSALHKNHPEWIMRTPGRDLLLRRTGAALDVPNPQVQEFMYQSVAAILKAYPKMRFVKWDCNSSLNNPYSPFLGPKRQGEMPFRYMEGYYRTLAKLSSENPGVDFQACAAGGGRADLGSLKNSHTFWPSDNTDPDYRLQAIWNYTLCLPPMAATCHVTQAGSYSVKYRFDVAMMGQLGLEVDSRKISAEYAEASKVGIAAYKIVRDVVQLGDQYRHKHPTSSTTPSLNYVSENKWKALLLAYQTAKIANPLVIYSPLSGLNPELKYRCYEINLPAIDPSPRLSKDCPAVQTGTEWMNKGIPLLFTRKNDSAAVVFEVIDEN